MRVLSSACTYRRDGALYQMASRLVCIQHEQEQEEFWHERMLKTERVLGCATGREPGHA